MHEIAWTSSVLCPHRILALYNKANIIKHGPSVFQSPFPHFVRIGERGVLAGGLDEGIQPPRGGPRPAGQGRHGRLPHAGALGRRRLLRRPRGAQRALGQAVHRGRARRRERRRRHALAGRLGGHRRVCGCCVEPPGVYNRASNSPRDCSLAFPHALLLSSAAVSRCSAGFCEAQAGKL